MGIRFLNGGLLTTVQDAGRRGYQRYGVSVSGAVDVRSHVCANILVGNSFDEAVLEATLMGPSMEFTSPSVIAITGGDLSPKLNGSPCPMYQAVRAAKGDVLSFGQVRSGCRAYIAFAGGLEITPVMGSRSTFLKAGLGGFEGRKLMTGDEIAFRDADFVPKDLEKRIMKPESFGGNYTVRVLMGPQEESFTEKGITTFLSSPYSVTKDFDRMGLRLTGEKIEHVASGNIITDGVSFGAIQVPDGGEPIIMLSDRQTTGGYTKIASVITADMPMIAQCKAGDTVRFIKTDIETAQSAFIAQREKYLRMRAEFDSGAAVDTAAGTAAAGFHTSTRCQDSRKRYQVFVDGIPFDVTVSIMD